MDQPHSSHRNGWMDGYMYVRMDGWMDGWMDGCTDRVFLNNPKTFFKSSPILSLTSTVARPPVWRFPVGSPSPLTATRRAVRVVGVRPRLGGAAPVAVAADARRLEGASRAATVATAAAISLS